MKKAAEALAPMGHIFQEREDKPETKRGPTLPLSYDQILFQQCFTLHTLAGHGLCQVLCLVPRKQKAARGSPLRGTHSLGNIHKSRRFVFKQKGGSPVSWGH